MKMSFSLETPAAGELTESGTISIIGKKPKNSPYVAISIPGVWNHFIRDKDLEKFAVNVLKSLNKYPQPHK